MIAEPAHSTTRGWQKQDRQRVVPAQQLHSSMHARRLPSQPRPVPGTGGRKEGNPYNDVDFSALFAHLMHLGRETKTTPASPAVAGTAMDDPPKQRHLSTPSTATSTRDDAFFKQDAAKVLRWMKYASEDLKIDAVVVASAATLALRYLRRSPFRGGLGRRHQRRTTITTRKSNDTPSTAASSDRSVSGRRQSEQREGRVGIEKYVTAVLLSATALHLASKYHDVYDKKVESFGTNLNPQRIYKLGFEISLSMGAALNSSFRANPVTLQSLFCAIADESAVVRACSEWFALCLVLLLPPSDEVVTALPKRHASKALSDVAAVVASHATSAGTTSAATASAMSTGTPTSSESGSTADSQRNSPTTGGSSSSPRTYESMEQGRQLGQRRDARSCGFSRATTLALGALALARRLARSKGRCIPVQVQATMGLRSDEALKLVAEGIAAARCVFGTEVGERSDGANAGAGNIGAGGERGNGGHELLAGESVFGQLVVDAPQWMNRICRTSQGGLSNNAETRTLLEWVTDCRIDNPALDTRPKGDAGGLMGRKVVPAVDHLPIPPHVASTPIYAQNGAAIDGESANFVKGFPLLGAVDRSPPCHRFGNARKRTPYSTLDGATSTANSSSSITSPDHGGDEIDSWSYSSSSSSRRTSNSNNTSSSSSSNSSSNSSSSSSTGGGGGGGGSGNEEEYGMTVGEYLLSRCNRHKAEEGAVQTDGESVMAMRNSASKQDTEDGQSDSASSSSISSTAMPSLQAMRGGVPWNLHTPTDDSSTPYFKYADLPRAWFPRDDTDVVGDNDITSSPRRASLLVDATSVDSPSSGGAVEDGASGKRGTIERTGPSWTALANSQQKKAKNLAETSSPSEQHRRLPLPSADPKEGRHSRWEILKDRLLVVLEDDCGCSFCEQRDGESSIMDVENSSNTEHSSTNLTNCAPAPRECVPEKCFSFQREATTRRGFISADGILVKEMRPMSPAEGGEGGEKVATSAEVCCPLLQLSAAAIMVKTSAATLSGEATFPRISRTPEVRLEHTRQKAIGMQTEVINEERVRDISSDGSNCNDGVTTGVGVAHKTSIASSIGSTFSRSFSHTPLSTTAAAQNTFTSARVRLLHNEKAPIH